LGNGGRTRWAHVEFTRINIELTILKKEIEDVHEARASMGFLAYDLSPRGSTWISRRFLMTLRHSS
jgi:hypothetical protein